MSTSQRTRLPNLDEVVLSNLPVLKEKTVEDGTGGRPPVDAVRGSGGPGYLVARSGLSNLVCEYVYCGYSDSAIARRLGLTHDAVTRYTKSKEFQALYAERYGELQHKTREFIFDILQNAAVEMLQDKLKDARNQKLPARLRNQIRSEVLEMYERLAVGREEGKRDILREVHERIIKLDGEGKPRPGSTAIERITTITSAPSRPAGANVAGGRGEEDGIVPVADPEAGSESAAEVHGGNASPRFQ